MSSDPKWLDENDAEIVIEAPCFVTDPGGTEHRIERGDLGMIPALLALQSHVITEVSADGSTLRTVFDNGSTLAVPALDQYEAWRVEGPGDQGVVCMPGGELAVWYE
ncbi:MAG TPA: DUF6188 family protein [Gaiellaceae bacterium]|nr:DUF6188 family protein [Gaiellaceae bacterium]